MISRRILAAVALLCAVQSAHGQTGSVKTPAQMNTEINTLYPDNTNGAITPFSLRQTSLDQVASVPFLNTANLFSAVNTFSQPPIFSSLTGYLQANGAGPLTLATAGAATLLGNPTGSGANVSAFTIQGLTNRGTPDAANDKLPIYDNAAGTIKYATPGNIVAGAGINTSGAVLNDVLYYNGTSFIHITITSVINAVCSLSPGTCGYLFGSYSAAWFGVVGYARTNSSTTGCASGAGAAPDDTTAISTAANQSYIVTLPPNRCYKITQWVIMNTNSGGLRGDRSAAVWMPAASFNNATPSGTLNPLASNALGFYIQGQLTTPFTPVTNITLTGFQIISEVADHRAVGPIAVRNATNPNLTNLELAGFPVGVGIFADSMINYTITGNYIHDFTSDVTIWPSLTAQIMGLAVDGSRVNGVSSRYGHVQNNLVQNIIFSNSTTGQQQTVGLGIFSQSSAGENVVTGNTITNTGECIDFYASSSTVNDNVTETCLQSGINVKHGGSFNTIAHNVIRASGLYGITISGDNALGSDGNLVDSNNIVGLDPLSVNSGSATACFRYNGNGGTVPATKNMVQNNYCDASGGQYGYLGNSDDGTGNFHQNNYAAGYSVQFQSFSAGVSTQWGTFTVAQLLATGQACTVSTKGLQFIVSDLASAPAYLSTLPGSGGGSVNAAYRCNGTSWVAGG